MSLSAEEAQEFAGSLVLEHLQSMFADLDEQLAIDEYATRNDIKINDEDWDLIADFVNTATIRATVHWDEGED